MSLVPLAPFYLSSGWGGPEHAALWDVSQRPLVKTQINQIRRNVQAEGESFASCEELRVLCSDEVTFTRQLDRVTEIAQQEGWNFAFLTDGSVRFASRGN